MRRGQYLIALLLGALIAAGALIVADRILFPYRHLQEVAEPVSPPHPLVIQIEKAKKLRSEGKLDEARRLLSQQLRIYPNAEPAQAARDLLGELNTKTFFSKDNAFGKTEYVVKRGDSLWRIARKLDSTPALIMRANDLESDLIHPGDQLIIPDSDFTLTLDLPDQRVVVHHGDGFFKQYPIVDFNLPDSNQTRIATKVMAATFWKDGSTVSSDEEEPPKIYLDRGGYALYGVEESAVDDSIVEIAETREDAQEKDRSRQRHGIALLKDDLTEIQQFIRRGTPVTIIRSKP